MINIIAVALNLWVRFLFDHLLFLIFVLVSGLISKSHNVRFKCIHYYACICALASDLKYNHEFSHFLSYEFGTKEKNKQIEKVPKINKMEVSYSLLAKSRNIRNSKTKLNKIKEERRKTLKKLAPKIYPVEIKVLEDQNPINTNLEKITSWEFLDWLTFATESINQTMQFENYGNLNSLIFCIPEVINILIN